MRWYRHEFGDNRTLDYVVRLAELVRRYQFLVDEMLEARPAFMLGGEQTMDAYLYRIEMRVFADALAYCGGNQAKALKLLGVSCTRYSGLQGVRRGVQALRPRKERDRL